jgi:hypothetical protein
MVFFAQIECRRTIRGMRLTLQQTGGLCQQARADAHEMHIGRRIECAKAIAKTAHPILPSPEIPLPNGEYAWERNSAPLLPAVRRVREKELGDEG